MSDFTYLRDVVTLALDQEKCVGCGMCLMVCPQAVLSMNNGCAGSKTGTNAWSAGPVPGIAPPKL